MIYDKKSDILPRLCFGLIYPPPKKAKATGCRGFRFFVSVFGAYDEVFNATLKFSPAINKVFARLLGKAATSRGLTHMRSIA